jgi:tripartite-type tricarboxylate transporter receptor subunit TctC
MQSSFVFTTAVMRLVTLAGVLFALSGVARAQPSYPAKPVTLIVASAPGAGVDFFARMLAERMRTLLGQAMVVENRVGAAGMMIAAGQVAKAAPDGHTLLLMPNTAVITPYVLAKQATVVRVIDELEPVIMPVATIMVLAVNGKFAVTSVQELVTLAKKQPGLHYATGVNTSPMHIIGEQFKKAAGVDMEHVPYNGVAQSVTALMGAQVNVSWMPTSGNMQHFKSGALRALATSSPKRSPLMPGVPTMIELGYKDISADAWFGVLAPLGTPAPVITALNRHMNSVLTMPDMLERLIPAGYVPEGGGPERLAAQMRADDSYYKKLIEELRIKVD